MKGAVAREMSEQELHLIRENRSTRQEYVLGVSRHKRHGDQLHPGFIGVWLGGYLHDLTGSYDLMWQLGVVMGLLAAIVHLPIDEAPVARLRQGQEAGDSG